MIKKIAYGLLMCSCVSGCSMVNLRASTYNLKASTHSQSQNPIVTMTLDNEQQILIELYPQQAPNTVNNFISLIQEGYYDGLTFHRIIENYMIQSGDPLRNNYGTPGYTIKGEFKNNGVKNSLKHDKGVISMARGSKYDSAGSQFFITLGKDNRLNGDYAAFGKVIQGMEVVKAIGHMGPDPDKKELNVPIIITMTVDTKMGKYSEPMVIPIDSK